MSKEIDLAKNTAIISVGKICTQLISFFLLPLYTSVLNTSEYGTVDLLISYSSMLLPVIAFAIEQALFRYLIDVRADEEKKDIIISTTVLFCCFQMAITVLVLGIIQIFLRNQYMPFFILVVAACTFSAIMLQLSRGIGDNVGYALGSFITAAVQIVCNIVFLVMIKMGANAMLLATFAGNMACALLLVVKTKMYKHVKLKKFEIDTLKQMLKYSVPLIPNQLSWWTMNASDKTIVAFVLGTASNGLLAVAHKFPSMYIQFNNIFNISWTESATLHIHEDEAEEFFTEIINSVFKLFACVDIGIIVCVPFVINWLVDESYFEAYDQIPIFMLASLCNVVVSLYGVVYVAYKKTKEIALTAVYAAIINVGSHLILICFLGLYAASVSTLLGYGAMAVYRYFHSRRYLVIKFSGRLLAVLGVMAAAALATYYMRIFVLHIMALVFVTVLSLIMNRKMLLSSVYMGMSVIKKLKKR